MTDNIKPRRGELPVELLPITDAKQLRVAVVRDRGQRYMEDCDRNREHLKKTIERNMGETQSKWEIVDHLVRTGQTDKAIRWAAECYACRAFVLGVISGRGHSLPDKELEQLKQQWEDQWDKTFGDLIGQTLKMQEAA